MSQMLSSCNWGGGGGCSQFFDSLIRYCGASNNNTNSAIVSSLTALGLLGHGPWAILDRNALRISIIGLLSLARALY